MASSSVGGLSGAFIPVSEDAGMIAAARNGVLSIEKLEAMTAVCSVGLDMIVIPGDTASEVISAIIADEAAIGMVNSKTTAVQSNSCYRTQRRRRTGLWRTFRLRTGHAAQKPVPSQDDQPRRTDSGSAAEFKKLEVKTMTKVRLGKTEIITNKNGFGALPIQRIPYEEAEALIYEAYDNGMTFLRYRPFLYGQ